MNPGTEVVSVPDHRRPGGTADRGLDFLLDRGQAARDDLEQDRVGVLAAG